MNYFTTCKHCQPTFSFLTEVRHADWFAKPDITREDFETLKSLNIGAVITDTSGRRYFAHRHFAISKVLIRYVGTSFHATDYTRINE